MLVWFQLDGAPPHSVLLAREWLNTIFGEQWIGRYGPHRWPAQSSNLTPLNFVLWGFIKNEVYSRNRSENELRTRIVATFDKLKAMTWWTLVEICEALFGATLFSDVTCAFENVLDILFENLW